MRVTPNTLFNEFERLFEREAAQPLVRHNLTIALDVTEGEDVYTVVASIPGINPDDVNIVMEDDVLTIEGQIASNDDEDMKYHLRERRYGSFKRSIRFPLTVDADAITADYDRGLLTLSVPKAEIVKPRRIEINVK